MELSNVWIALLAAFLGGGTIGSIYAVMANRKLKSAEAGTMIADAALALLEPYQKQVERLDDRISSLEEDGRVTREAMTVLESQHEELQHANEMLTDKVNYLWAGTLKNIEQLQRLGHDPDWEPDKTQWRDDASKET